LGVLKWSGNRERGIIICFKGEKREERASRVHGGGLSEASTKEGERRVNNQLEKGGERGNQGVAINGKLPTLESQAEGDNAFHF